MPERYPLPKQQRTKAVILTAIVDHDAQGRPVLNQRPASGLFGGLWGPVYEDGRRKNGAAYIEAGVVNHQLSHRSMTVHVLVGTSAVGETGTQASSVACSTLDEKVLAMASQRLLEGRS